MTESEAVEAARRYLQESSASALQFHSVNKVTTADFPADYPGNLQGQRDFWVVRFTPPTEDGVIECPGLVLLDVDDESGEVTPFDAL
jgi:hypothetical protein